MTKSLWQKFQDFQKRIDFTPKLIAISEKFAKNQRISFFFFFLFLVVGFLGLFLPLVQGWLVIALSVTFLGIKPLNKWMATNRKAVMNVGTIGFMIGVGMFMFSVGTWATGYSETSPIDDIMSIVQWGQDDLVEINTQAFSIVGVDYVQMQQAFSIVNYDSAQGFYLGGI
jgi:hypothetical protein